MAELTFMTTKGEESIIKCNLEDKMKNVCKKYALSINENYKNLVFFLNGKRIDKKIKVREFKENNKNDIDFILVKIMDINIESDSDEEKASIDLKKKIIDEIKNSNANPTYDEMQELVVQYGYDTEKKIEEEVKKNPENFINTDEALKQQNSNEKIFVLGKLGKSLENMGIKVVIDKRENLKNDDYIINNQIISSGILKQSKYEIKIEENDKKKQYEVLNNEKEQKKFIDKWKRIISNYLTIPEKDIFLTNLRKGSLEMDCILKRIDIKEIKGKNINIDEKMKILANSHSEIIQIFKKNILGGCKLTLDMLDEKGNQHPGGWAKPG